MSFQGQRLSRPRATHNCRTFEAATTVEKSERGPAGRREKVMFRKKTDDLSLTAPSIRKLRATSAIFEASAKPALLPLRIGVWWPSFFTPLTRSGQRRVVNHRAGCCRRRSSTEMRPRARPLGAGAGPGGRPRPDLIRRETTAQPAAR
jgi:hypothetical protein